MNRRDFLKFGVGVGVGFAGSKLINSNNSSALLDKVIAESYTGHSSNTYYFDSQNSRIELPTLVEDLNCDVCVVGGGLTGISTALKLAERGYKVVLLEAQNIAGQASGMNGGQVLTAYECGMEYFEDKFGDKIAKQLWSLSLQAIDIVKSNIKNHNINCSWQSGTGIAAYKEKHFAALQEEYAIMTEKYGYTQVELYDKQQTRTLIGSDQYYGLLYDRFAGHIHPLNYALGISQICKQKAQMFINSRVTEIKFNQAGGLHHLTVNGKHQVKAKFVVLACNYQNSLFAPELAYKVVKFDTYVMATESLSPSLAHEILPNRMAVFDSRNVMNYYRLTEQNNLIFGGGDTFGKPDVPQVQKSLYNDLINTFPQLAGVKVKNFWYGADSITLNLAPNFGRLHDTVYYAQGYSGQGLSLSNLAGQIIADAIIGQSEKFDIFATIKPLEITNIGVVQQAFVKMGSYYFRMKDYLE